jgi:hypothetical protein
MLVTKAPKVAVSAHIDPAHFCAEHSSRKICEVLHTRLAYRGLPFSQVRGGLAGVDCGRLSNLMRGFAGESMAVPIETDYRRRAGTARSQGNRRG